MATVGLLAGIALATWQAVRASRERDAKEAARRQAVAAGRQETRLREQAQAEAYASDMLLAQQAIAANNFGFARTLLFRHRPEGKAARDLRGWEWRYLWQQCTSDALAKAWQATNKVTDLAVSPDGKWLAVGQNSDRAAVSVLEFVDRTTARLVTNIPPRRGTDVVVAFSPTAPWLAFGSTRYEGTRVQPTVCLWDVETGRQLLELPVRSFCVALAFSPDGSTLLVTLDNHHGNSDGQVLLLHVPDGALVWSYDTPIPNPCPRIPVDPAFRVAAVPSDGIKVIDLLTGKPRWSATNDAGGFFGSTFTRDGAMLLTTEGSPSVLHVWDVNSGKPIGGPVPLHRGKVDPLLWLDGVSLASASADGTIQLWDASDPTAPRALGRPLRGQLSDINTLVLGADGKTLLSGSFDGSVYAWDTTLARPDQSALVLPEVFDWQFAPDNGFLLTIDPQGRVTRLEGADFQVKKPVLAMGAELARVRDQTAFSSDGELLATSRDGVVRVWDLRANDPSPRLVTPGWLVAHSFAPSSKLFIIYDQAGGSVQEWNLNTLQNLGSWPGVLPFSEQGPFLALSARGEYVLNVSADGDDASVREVATGEASTWQNLGAGIVFDANFSPDGALLAVASIRGFAQVWERASQRLVATAGHHQSSTWAVDFSPDGRRLVTASDGPDALTLWDLGGRELLRLPARGSIFQSPRFSADGNLLGCRNWENELFLWRAPSWEEIDARERTTPDAQ